MKDEKASAGRAAARRIRVCFVTGTRAEFGLMRRVLLAIKAHPLLQLQLIVTGMHLHSAHGKSINQIRKEGWRIDLRVPWKQAGSNATLLASHTGIAIAGLSKAFKKLESDVVLVVGDRVEAFAAATAAHISGRVLAHVHGGDRAPGQIDDSLRHAISKLAHVHFPATRNSADRLLKLGEDRWRIHQVGSPGIDGITADAAPADSLFRQFPMLRAKRFAILLLHPVDGSNAIESARAEVVLSAIARTGIPQVVAIHPNNDPGCDGIIRTLKQAEPKLTYLLPDVARPMFLGLMREAAMLVGNSSSGIIEAASFGTPVVDIGPRQLGRDRSQNVMSVTYSEKAIRGAVKAIWNAGTPLRWRGRNIYGGIGTAERVVSTLAQLDLHNPILRRKLISY